MPPRFRAKWNRPSAFCCAGGLKVDEQVAAADEVDPRERRILDDVVRREHDHLPQFGDDLIAARAREK